MLLESTVRSFKYGILEIIGSLRPKFKSFQIESNFRTNFARNLAFMIHHIQYLSPVMLSVGKGQNANR